MQNNFENLKMDRAGRISQTQFTQIFSKIRLEGWY